MYGFTATLTDVGFDHALEKTVAALKAEGFGVLSDIDVQRAMKDKLGVEKPRSSACGAPARAWEPVRPEPPERAGSGRDPARQSFARDGNGPNPGTDRVSTPSPDVAQWRYPQRMKTTTIPSIRVEPE